MFLHSKMMNFRLKIIVATLPAHVLPDSMEQIVIISYVEMDMQRTWSSVILLKVVTILGVLKPEGCTSNCTCYSSIYEANGNGTCRPVVPACGNGLIETIIGEDCEPTVSLLVSFQFMYVGFQPMQ